MCVLHVKLLVSNEVDNDEICQLLVYLRIYNVQLWIGVCEYVCVFEASGCTSWPHITSCEQ